MAMDRAAVIAKLEQIASGGGSIAELQACKALLALPELAGEPVKSDPFAELDAHDELASRRAA